MESRFKICSLKPVPRLAPEIENFVALVHKALLLPRKARETKPPSALFSAAASMLSISPVIFFLVQPQNLSYASGYCIAEILPN